MADEWIKFVKNTPDKPEVWEIAAALQIDPDAVVGKLLRVWGWFDDHSTNGNAPSVTKLLLDRLVGVVGFCDAVISTGWITEESNAISVTNFEAHNGETAKKRAQTAKRAAKHRKNSESNADSNARSVTQTIQDALPRKEEEKKVITEVTNVTSEGKTCVSPIVDPEDEFEKPPKPKIKFSEVVNLYHEVLPELPAVQKLTDSRRRQITARFRQDLPDLDTWREYFEYVRESPFLMGREPPGKDRTKPFIADLEFLTSESKFTRVWEGKYHEGGNHG